MTGITRSTSIAGGATVPTTAGVPSVATVALTDGEGAVLTNTAAPNTGVVLLTAVGVTTTQTSTDQTNLNGSRVTVVLDMTTVGTGSVTLSIQGKDPASGKYYTLLSGAAVTTNSTNVYYVYPGAPATANVSANAPLPKTWRVQAVANNANATTYTVGALVNV
jgi:hypothetical protein